MKKQKKMIVNTVIIVLSIAFGVWAITAERGRRKNIRQTGIETVGTVINKPILRSNKGIESFNIIFEFEHDGERIVTGQTGTWSYDNAIIGKQYKVKYLPNNPREALIFIDQPLSTTTHTTDD